MSTPPICQVGDFDFCSNDDKGDLPDARRFDPKTHNVHAEEALSHETGTIYYLVFFLRYTGTCLLYKSETTTRKLKETRLDTLDFFFDNALLF